VLRYYLRRRCSHNPRVGGGARVLKTLIPNPCVSRLYTYQFQTEGTRTRQQTTIPPRRSCGGEVEDGRRGDHVAEGPCGTARGPLRTPHASPSDTSEEQPVMMSRKKHTVDERWATQSRLVIEQNSEKLPKRNLQQQIFV
jgi:hypothetical protein